jgi:hypothetical protein
MSGAVHQRNWLNLLTFCLVRAVALSLAFAVVLVAATVAFAGGDARKTPRKVPRNQFQSLSGQSFSGVVTDSECGARHDKGANMSSAECARFCIRNGARYTLVDGETTYVLNGNTADLGKLAGQRVKIAGTRDGDAIQVSSVGLQ